MAATEGGGSVKGLGAAMAPKPSSVKADWQVCHSDLTVDNSTQLLIPTNSALSSSVIAMTVPDGCTRVVIRGRATTGSYAVTTSPVVWLYSVDANGVPTRIDNADSNATGVTITFAASTDVASDGTYYYSDIPSLTGYDLIGGTKFLMLTDTASSLGSATQQGLCLFLN